MKNIILGITASIAAYKAAELTRLLKQQGAEVQIVMTEHAQAFITPLTLQALSGKPVLCHWSAAETDAGMDHIALARWADAIICAPASADFVARLAHGMADDLLSTLCLATSAPVIVAPAMNPQMWANPATQSNVQTLKQRGIKFLGPAMGDHACGEEGLGRMEEPINILQAILVQQIKSLAGQRILITAGPTQEALDPVRYLTNHSSGKMGFALAEAALAAGADVTLITGPVALTCNASIKRIDVVSAEDMLNAVMQCIPSASIFISAAAVADYQPKEIANNKLKKSDEKFKLDLVRTPDILHAVANLKIRPFTVGFALETENLLENAKKKLHEKKLDMLIANQTGAATGFNKDTNAATLLLPNSPAEEFPVMTKALLAQQLINRIAQQIAMR
ncbi:MAG: bifunctional phosphopantothenoylcysteine decarboxylase/phosphopantothenate--cysteine ligase CoaBC [Gammaproteobacteria bacterium]